MTATELLDSLHRRGFHLAVGDGDSLVVSPRSNLTPELKEMLRLHKPALIGLLRPQSFDDVKSGVRRLERQLAGETDLDLFLLIVQHQGDPDPPSDLEALLYEQIRACGVTGRQCVVAHSPHYGRQGNGHALGSPWLVQNLPLNGEKTH